MLQVNNISFSYSNTSILKHLSFKVDKGEHLAVIGESGSGKSTLLKAIYGLLQLNDGTIFWNENQVLGPNYNLVPGEKYMKYLAQDFDLMPYTTVAENISQFLSVFYPKELKERTDELLGMIEMHDFANTKVKNLSGGQQQRVALARVLAQEPELLLLDEPFSHIDNFTKNGLRRNLFAYLKNKGIGVITATHDSNDVIPFSDKVIVIKDKEIIANEATLLLFDNPRNIYVANLFAEANLIPIDVIKSYANTKRRIVVYAHEFKVSKTSGISVIIKNNYALGTHYLIEGMTDTQSIFFNYDKPLEKDSIAYLNVSLDIINKRLT